MMGLKYRDQSWIILFIFAVTILDPSVSKGAQGKYYFPPSSSQVETVILSHTWAYNDPRNAFEINGKKLEDPRLRLIRDIARLFPKINIILNTNMAVEDFYESYPDLKGKLKGVVPYVNHSIQDAFEFAYDHEGELVILSTNYMFPEKIQKFFPGTKIETISTGEPKPAFQAWRSSSERYIRYAGGNIEFLLDGTPLLGKNIPKKVYDWFKNQSGEVLTVDSAWNSSGDLDEIFLITSDPLAKNDCIVFYLDALAGREILIQTIESLHQQDNWTKLPAERQEELVGYLTKSQIAKDLQAVIRRDLETIISQDSMKNCRTQAIPQLYAEDKMSFEDKALISQNDFKPQISMVFGNQVNSLVIGNHVFLLESQFLPQQMAVEAVYENNGFTIHKYTPMAFDSGGGQMHCSTNTVRKNGSH